MSDSGERKPVDVGHIVDVQLGGGRDIKPAKRGPRRARGLRVIDPRIEPGDVSPTTFTPRAGLPAGGRDECKDGERPCPYVRCRHHLWRIDGEDRAPAGRASNPNGDPARTTLIAAWLEYPTPMCCSLDVADGVAEGRFTQRDVDRALHLSRNRVWELSRDALGEYAEQLRDALGEDGAVFEDLSAGQMRAAVAKVLRVLRRPLPTPP